MYTPEYRWFGSVQIPIKGFELPKPKRINTFDVDGVLYTRPDHTMIYPGPNDIIVTGRSFEEEEETLQMLHDRGIYNQVIFNPIPFNEKTRETSGIHKGHTINDLQQEGYEVVYHIEDDPIQVAIIKGMTSVKVIHVNHDNEIDYENIRQGER